MNGKTAKFLRQSCKVLTAHKPSSYDSFYKMQKKAWNDTPSDLRYQARVIINQLVETKVLAKKA